MLLDRISEIKFQLKLFLIKPILVDLDDFVNEISDITENTFRKKNVVNLL